MSRNTKIGCLVAAIAFIVISVVVCAGGAFLGVDWAKETSDDFANRMPEITAEAERVAAGGADACVTDGTRRSRLCSEFDIKCRVEAHVRTRTCLEIAAPPRQFCADVPPQTSIVDVSLYAIRECQRLGFAADDEHCTRMYTQTVPKYCDIVRRR